MTKYYKLIDMNYQKLINNNIKNLRLKNQLTQEEFAEKIGISIQGLSNLERNRYHPNSETIDKICKVFKMSPIELLVETSNDKFKILNNINALLSQCHTKKIKTNLRNYKYFNQIILIQYYINKK